VVAVSLVGSPSWPFGHSFEGRVSLASPVLFI